MEVLCLILFTSVSPAPAVTSATWKVLHQSSLNELAEMGVLKFGGGGGGELT